MKRLADIIISFVALLILSPVALAVSLFVRVKLGSPILFRQFRSGKNGDSFEIMKFCSMLDSVGKDGAPG
jgi:lipopolysaccharide/colanic/teichoic acid biosynthesis glycosyltransferase